MDNFQRCQWCGSEGVVRLPPTGIALEEIERQAIMAALRMTHGVQNKAAELLHISPRIMNYKIKILKIPWEKEELW